MGDFYELFFEDAVQAAKTLGIILTKRGTGGLGDGRPKGFVHVDTRESNLVKWIY